MPKLDNETIQLILVALVALAMLVQAIVLWAAFIAFRKVARDADEKLDDIRSSVVPLVDKTRALITSLTPKIEGATDDFAALAHSLRIQAADVQHAANEVVGHIRNHATRLDTMLSNVFDTLDRAGAFVSDAVNRPVRQIQAILASIKAVIESLRTGEPVPRSQGISQGPPHGVPLSGDRDMFV